MTPDEARAAWAQLRESLSARPAGSTSMAEQLDADRRSREQALTGRVDEIRWQVEWRLISCVASAI